MLAISHMLFKQPPNGCYNIQFYLIINLHQLTKFQNVYLRIKNN